MGNKNNNQKNLWIYISGTLFVFALFALYMERHGYSSYLSNILSFIGIIVSIILAKKPSSSIPCNNKTRYKTRIIRKSKTVRGKRLFDVFGGTAIVDGFLSLLQSFLHYYLRPQSAINYTIIKSSKKNICCNDNLMNWLKDLNIEQKNL